VVGGLGGFQPSDLLGSDAGRAGLAEFCAGQHGQPARVLARTVTYSLL